MRTKGNGRRMVGAVSAIEAVAGRNAEAAPAAASLVARLRAAAAGQGELRPVVWDVVHFGRQYHAPVAQVALSWLRELAPVRGERNLGGR